MPYYINLPGWSLPEAALVTALLLAVPAWVIARFTRAWPLWLVVATCLLLLAVFVWWLPIVVGIVPGCPPHSWYACGDARLKNVGVPQLISREGGLMMIGATLYGGMTGLVARRKDGKADSHGRLRKTLGVVAAFCFFGILGIFMTFFSSVNPLSVNPFGR